jgi:hypothetical protein
VGHKHTHLTVVPIFVVAANKKERSPFWTRIASPRAEAKKLSISGNYLTFVVAPSML